MIEVAVFSSLESAYIAKGMLENHNIPAKVTENALNAVFPAPSAYNGGIALYVAEKNVDAAKSLLRDHGDIK